MATEAQKLIGISLSKIAQSRGHRGGVSLHKNLLVATVLQKARFIFMEEAYHMVHAGNYCTTTTTTPVQISQRVKQTYQLDYTENNSEDGDNLVALTPEEAGISNNVSVVQETTNKDTAIQHCVQSTTCNCSEDCSKENVHPNVCQKTYLDLDKSSLNTVLRDRYRQKCGTNSTCLKRRRAITEWETEEAVLSILPKKSKQSVVMVDSEIDEDDSVFLGDSTSLSDCVARETALASEAEQKDISISNGQSMEIDRITSLVSIFSFGSLSVGAPNKNNADCVGKLTRSVSTPDLCSSQAKESETKVLQQRPFITMTV